MAIKYNQYAFILGELANKYLKSKYHSKKARGKISLKEALSEFLPDIPQIFRVVDGSIAAEEWNWYKTRNIIFPESAETLENLNRGKYRIEIADGIQPPYESFVLNIPKEFKLAGKKCPGLLVSSHYMEDRLDKLFKPFIHDIGFDIDANKAVITGRHVVHTTGRFLAVTYSNKITQYGHELARVCIPWAILPEVLSSKSASEYLEIIGSFPENGRIDKISDLTEDEGAFQFELIKMLVRMFVYIQACDALIPGLHMSGKDSAPQIVLNGKPPVSSVFRMAHSPEAVSLKTRPGHPRGFFLRQLRDDRFYRGEYSCMPHGSRFIFVRETWVGEKAELSTLVSKVPSVSVD